MIDVEMPPLWRENWEDDALIRTISAGVLGLLVAATGVATAQDAEDVAHERKVRKLAVNIGKAYACTDKKGHDKFKEESHHLFDLIVQDVGSDLGFVYATGIGQGSMVPKEKLDCPKLLKEWEEIRDDYDLKGDER
jgi:N-acetylglutamate synthase/N-acetylornithine aminotransferase